MKNSTPRVPASLHPFYSSVSKQCAELQFTVSQMPGLRIPLCIHRIYQSIGHGRIGKLQIQNDRPPSIPISPLSILSPGCPPVFTRWLLQISIRVAAFRFQCGDPGYLSGSQVQPQKTDVSCDNGNNGRIWADSIQFGRGLLIPDHRTIADGRWHNKPDWRF